MNHKSLPFESKRIYFFVSFVKTTNSFTSTQERERHYYSLWLSKIIKAIRADLLFDRLCDQPVAPLDLFLGELVSPRDTSQQQEQGRTFPPAASESISVVNELLGTLSRESQTPAEKKQSGVKASIFSHNPDKPFANHNAYIHIAVEAAYEYTKTDCPPPPSLYLCCIVLVRKSSLNTFFQSSPVQTHDA